MKSLLDKNVIEDSLRPYYDTVKGKFVDNDGNEYGSPQEAIKQAQIIDYLTEKKDYSPYIITNNGTKIQTENEFKNNLKKQSEFNAQVSQEVKRLQKAKGGVVKDPTFTKYKKGGPVKNNKKVEPKKKIEPEYKFKIQKADLQLQPTPELLKKEFEDAKKNGLIDPETTFERFEKNYHDIINNILSDDYSLKDRSVIDEISLQSALSKLDAADSGIGSLYGKKKIKGDDLLSKLDRSYMLAKAARSLNLDEDRQVDLLRRRILNSTKQELRPKFSKGGLGFKLSKDSLIGFLKSEFPKDYIRMEDRLKIMSPAEIESELEYLRDLREPNRKNFAAGGNGSIPKISRKEFLRLPFKQRINLMYGLDLSGDERVSEVLEKIKSMHKKVEVE